MASGWRNPKYDIRKESRTVLEQSLTLSLALFTLVFLTFVSFETRVYRLPGEMDVIQIESIPITDQLKVPVPPQRPQIPVATESEEIPDDVTIMDTNLVLDTPLPPPPALSGGGGGGARTGSRVLTSWEEPPELVRMVMPEYPRKAKGDGIEGYVLLNIIIDEKGDVVSARIAIAEPRGIFEDAAIQAVMKWKFRPARQKGVPIKVMIPQAVEFSLGNL